MMVLSAKAFRVYKIHLSTGTFQTPCYSYSHHCMDRWYTFALYLLSVNDVLLLPSWRTEKLPFVSWEIKVWPLTETDCVFAKEDGRAWASHATLRQLRMEIIFSHTNQDHLCQMRLNFPLRLTGCQRYTNTTSIWQPGGEKNDLQECFCLAPQPLALATICEAQHY